MRRVVEKAPESFGAGALDDGAQQLIDDTAFFADGGATDGFSGAEIEGLVRALASYALERASAGADAVVTARDVRSALDDVVSDRAASKKAASIRDAAWTELASLESKWQGGPPTDRAEVLAFLEARAYDVRDISLPLSRSDVDDLVIALRAGGKRDQEQGYEQQQSRQAVHGQLLLLPVNPSLALIFQP